MSQTTPSHQKTVLIRPARMDDAESLLQLNRELAEYQQKPVSEVKTTLNTLKTDVLNNHSLCHVFVAEGEAGRLEGFILFTLGYSIWNAAPTLSLEDIYVRESIRGSGLGRQLLQKACQEALTLGCCQVNLSVLNWNPARQFYERMGMELDTDWVKYGLSGETLKKLASPANALAS